MEKLKFYKIVILFLLVLNAGTLTFLFIGLKKNNGPGKNRNENTPAEFLIKELDLDNKQQADFEILKKEHQQQMHTLRDSIRLVRESMPELIIQGNDSLAAARLNAIGHYQTQIEIYTYAHFKKVYALCNPQQKQKFAEVIDDMLKMMAPPPPRKNGPPEGPPHP